MGDARSLAVMLLGLGPRRTRDPTPMPAPLTAGDVYKEVSAGVPDGFRSKLGDVF